jgi:hypothetical protein
MGGTFSTWLKKLTRDDDEVDADRLSGEADASGAVRAQICCQGERVTLQGRLRYVDLRPTDSLATLVAELYDGT